MSIDKKNIDVAPEPIKDRSKELHEKISAKVTEVMPPPEKDKKNDIKIDSNFILDCIRANELGDGLLYAALYKNKFIYDKNGETWFEFGPHCWKQDILKHSLAAVDYVGLKYLEEFARQNEKYKQAVNIGDKESSLTSKTNQKALEKRTYRLRSDWGRRNCLKYAHTNSQLPLEIDPQMFDRQPMLLACGNGVLDLHTGKLRNGRPDDYISKRSPINWEGIDADCSPWLEALNQIYNEDQGIIEYLARLFGYAIIGQQLESIFPVFWGRGRNGKSLLIETISHVLGDHAGPIPAEMLLDSSRANAASPTPEIMALKGLRVAIASETDEGRRFSPARVKWLTGGDTLTGRGLHDKKFTSFKPTHLLVLLTNHKPNAPDQDFAFWERAVLIPHKLSFVDRKPTAPYERPADKHLPAKLKKCAPGILAWLVRGCLIYQESGLDPPESIQKATKQYKQEEDLLHDFIEACCVIDPTAEAFSSELYNVFEKWFEIAIGGKRTPSHKRFSTLLNAREQFDTKKTSGKIKYLGIGINADSEFLQE